MITKGIRGAITVEENSADAIKSATLELLSMMIEKNNIIDKDKWSASLLYITYVFFNVIDKKYNLENYEFISENFINLCDEKICNVDTFYKLVKTTYNIMRDFYNDYMIKKIIGDNLPKFLKASIETNTNVQEILMDKIKGNIEFDS